jgi:hypothetical protein
MGSLIPSEMWDWSKDWPKAVIGVVVSLLIFGLIALGTVIW